MPNFGPSSIFSFLNGGGACLDCAPWPSEDWFLDSACCPLALAKSSTPRFLNDFEGKWLVIYFYPKDFTAGCTLEAKGFSELKKDFSKYNAEIIGISADNQDSHESFCSEKSINYTLLSDPDGIISEKYGSWIPPFSDRNTFLISPNGKISYRWISVLPLNHAKEVLNVLKKKI